MQDRDTGYIHTIMIPVFSTKLMAISGGVWYNVYIYFDFYSKYYNVYVDNVLKRTELLTSNYSPLLSTFRFS